MAILSDFITALKGKPFLVLDTETTGLQQGEIVEIAIVNNLGETLLDRLVKPKFPIPSDASKIHGITDERVAAARTWPEIMPMVLDILKGQNVVIYNAVYDRKMLHQTAERWGMEATIWKELASFYCCMEAYAEFYGDFNHYRGSYTWQPLHKAFRLCTGNDLANAHTAYVDSLACLEVTKFLLGRGIAVEREEDNFLESDRDES